MALPRNALIAVLAVAVVGAAGIAYLVSGGAPAPAPAPTPIAAAPASARPATPAAAAAPAASPTAPVETASAPAATGPWVVQPGELVIGRADAPVTMFSYESFTCPHCARFHVESLDAIRKEFVDTGMLRVVLRDFPFDRPGLAAGLIARCAGPERGFALAEVFFKAQDSWARDADPVAALKRMARLAGIDEAAANACLADKAVETALLTRQFEAQQAFGVESTPTFVLSGAKAPAKVEKIVGNQPIAQFREAIGRLAR